MTHEHQNEKSKRARQQYIADLNFVLGTPSGRRVLRKLLDETGIYTLSFAGESTHTTAFREGARNVGLTFNSDILEASPEHWLALRKGE